MITVHNSSELSEALSNATGGETIGLAMGDYGDIIVNRAYTQTVTITSISDANPAHITTALVINASNVLFQDIEFGGPLRVGAPDYTPVISVDGSTGIAFDHVKVHGSIDHNPSNDGNGLRFLESSNVKVTNSEFFELARALGFGNVHGGLASGNSFHDLRTHGIEVGGATNLDIIGNGFKDFYWRAGDHFDAIQLHTAGSSFKTENVTIADNVIVQGDGMGVQGIFAQDEYGNMPFEKLVISNNLVYMSAYNGILVRGANDVSIVGNSVLTPSTDAYESRLWIEDVSNVRLEGNLADVIVKAGELTNIDERFDVSLHFQPDYFTLFHNLDAGSRVVVSDLMVSGVGYLGYLSSVASQTGPALSDLSAVAPVPNSTDASTSVPDVSAVTPVATTAPVTTPTPTPLAGSSAPSQSETTSPAPSTAHTNTEVPSAPPASTGTTAPHSVTAEESISSALASTLRLAVVGNVLATSLNALFVDTPRSSTSFSIELDNGLQPSLRTNTLLEDTSTAHTDAFNDVGRSGVTPAFLLQGHASPLSFDHFSALG